MGRFSKKTKSYGYVSKLSNKKKNIGTKIRTISADNPRNTSEEASDSGLYLRNSYCFRDYYWIGFDLDYTDEYVKENAFQGRFQHLLFTRVMPNLKKIGLLPDRLLPKYEQLGVSEWIDLESDYETSWEELSKPLESVA